MLKRAGAERGRPTVFVAADLERDAGWPEAVAGCDFVLHVASPFPLGVPKDEDELIVPAREGALRVLQRGARRRAFERVVLTSSFAAIGYGHPQQTAPFDETSWTDVDAPGVSAYAKSKTLAERAAWDFVAQGGRAWSWRSSIRSASSARCSGPTTSTSIMIVQAHDGRRDARAAALHFGVVDVRDVADLHLRAMTDPAAKGERFLAVAGDFLSLREIALTLKARLGAAARRVPTRELPNWLVRLAALATGGPADRPRTRQAQERHQREGATPARLVAALARGRRRRDRREPGAARPAQGEGRGLIARIRPSSSASPLDNAFDFARVSESRSAKSSSPSSGFALKLLQLQLALLAARQLPRC